MRVEQRCSAVRRGQHAARLAAAGKAGRPQLGLYVHDALDSRVSVVRDHHHVGSFQGAVAFHPSDDPPELLVGRDEGAVGEDGAHARLVIGAVRLGEPDQRDRRVALRKHVLGQHPRPVLHLRNMRRYGGWPRAEALDKLVMQAAGQAELRVDRGPAQGLGARVLNVRVARSADAHGHVFFPVAVQDVRQRRRQQNMSRLLGHPGKLRLQGFHGVVRVVVADNKRVAGESVRAGVAARDKAGDVDPGYGGKHRMVSGKGDAPGGEGGEVWREVGPHL